MIPESLRQQIDRWFDGELPEAEQLPLQESLRQLPEALDYFCDTALLHQLLAENADLGNAIHNSPAAAELRPAEADPHLPPRQPQSTWQWNPRTLLWVASAVAGCALLCGLWFLPPAAASPAELVRRTLNQFQNAADRCYRVRVDFGGPLWRSGFRRRGVAPTSTLWVRGNSFVQLFETDDSLLIWGRNARGAVWFRMSDDSAAIFESDEVPQVLEDACELRTLQLTTLLESLLRDYELNDSSGDPGTRRILARRRSTTASAKYGDVEIDIDPRTLLVRHVALERLRDQRPVAVVSFSLVEVASRKDSLYEVTDHLKSDARVFDRSTRFGSRSELLREFLQKIRTPQSDSTDR